MLALVLLVGCAGPLIDHRYQARSQDHRVRYVILHYTHGDFQRALKTLTEGEVSSHYLISDEPAEIYQLVEEDRRAWHAGMSAWKNDVQLNGSSIGIELVNRGYQETPQGRDYAAYPPEQIKLLIALLKKIVARHQIAPDRILGHNEIAPQRKLDPGPLFPWQRLAEAGLIRWPDAGRVLALQQIFERELPEPAWFRDRLARYGYVLPPTGALDETTRQCLAAFQMKYRPARYDGVPDAETAALLDVLTTHARPVE
jgi:N-acetylmuramoyl-L-alanine amidase